MIVNSSKLAGSDLEISSKNKIKPINIVITGLGGEGIITLTKILAQTYFKAGIDICYNEIHGLSQRGGSLRSNMRIHAKNCPVFMMEDTDFIIGLEKLETLRILYEAKGAKPIVIVADYYEHRNTEYFGYEIFPEEKRIFEEIKKYAAEVYVFNSKGFKEKFSSRFKPVNIGILRALPGFEALNLPIDGLKTQIKQILGKNAILKQINLKAFKEGASWLKKL
ncbi:MAG: 2-oxoacid:acceptor oxidoreductase family protein [Promethearchaeota archaeon]